MRAELRAGTEPIARWAREFAETLGIAGLECEWPDAGATGFTEGFQLLTLRAPGKAVTEHIRDKDLENASKTGHASLKLTLQLRMAIAKLRPT
jgi:hypothetical protein